MVTQTLFRAALAALALFATATASHAQGVGGLLNKAKAKVNQATSAGANPRRAATATASQAVQGNDGELPPRPDDLTNVETMELYTQMIYSNTRPYDPDDREYADQYYRRMVYMYHMPIKITWDRATIVYHAGHGSQMTDWIEAWCSQLAAGANNGNSAVYVKPHAMKIKELHFGTTQALPTKEDNELTGFNLAWNPATGVLRIDVCTKPGYTPNLRRYEPTQGQGLNNWLIKNIK